MKFGIMTSKIDEIGYITHAENLGYSHCWVTDSPMLRSNCWAVLALAANATRNMQIGTGVNVPGIRQAPVTANGIATINRLAPGRCFISLGTGNTAARTLGQRPMKLKEFEEYIRVVKALLKGEEVEYLYAGESRKIQFQMLEHSFIDIQHQIKLYIAGFGPKAQQIAGDLGDGLISGIPRGRPKGTRDLAGYVLESTDGGTGLVDALVSIARGVMPNVPVPGIKVQERPAGSASRPVEGHRDAARPWLRQISATARHIPQCLRQATGAFV